jgi:RNA polymerase sigma-70 factor (ECF subfamily)
MPGSVSSSLLQRAVQLDGNAWERLVSLYYPLIYGWCRRYGLQPEDSADVSQEVFRSITTSLRCFRRSNSGDTFRGWLRRITKRRVYDFFRQRERQPEVIGGSDAQEHFAQLTVAVDVESAEDGKHWGLKNLCALVRCEFEHLTWEAFWRTTVDGVAATDVATALGMSRNAVYLARSRVLYRLREACENPGNIVVEGDLKRVRGASE